MTEGATFRSEPPDRDHEAADRYDKFDLVIDAANDFVESVLEEKALALLRQLDKVTDLHIEIFSNELEEWPYAGDPADASKLDLMFWAYQSDFSYSSVRKYFSDQLEKFSIHSIQSIDRPLKDLVVEVCYLADGDESTEITRAEMDKSAVRKLANIVEAYLSYYDRDILFAPIERE